MTDATDDLWYPSVDDILTIHEDIITEDDDAEYGVESPGRIEFALNYVRDGHFGEVPETIHEKAFHLMRLIASNHWFVDGNKRTALNTVELFYMVNGYELDYGEDIRSMLKLFSVREKLIDREAGPNYLKEQADSVELDSEGADVWTAIAIVVAGAIATHLDMDPDEYLPNEQKSVREGLGLTTFEEDGTVNNDEPQHRENDGG